MFQLAIWSSVVYLTKLVSPSFALLAKLVFMKTLLLFSFYRNIQHLAPVMASLATLSKTWSLTNNK